MKAYMRLWFAVEAGNKKIYLTSFTSPDTKQVVYFRLSSFPWGEQCFKSFTSREGLLKALNDAFKKDFIDAAKKFLNGLGKVFLNDRYVPVAVDEPEHGLLVFSLWAKEQHTKRALVIKEINRLWVKCKGTKRVLIKHKDAEMLGYTLRYVTEDGEMCIQLSMCMDPAKI